MAHYDSQVKLRVENPDVHEGMQPVYIAKYQPQAAMI